MRKQTPLHLVSKFSANFHFGVNYFFKGELTPLTNTFVGFGWISEFLLSMFPLVRVCERVHSSFVEAVWTCQLLFIQYWIHGQRVCWCLPALCELTLTWFSIKLLWNGMYCEKWLKWETKLACICKVSQQYVQLALGTSTTSQRVSLIKIFWNVLSIYCHGSQICC